MLLLIFVRTGFISSDSMQKMLEQRYKILDNSKELHTIESNFPYPFLFPSLYIFRQTNFTDRFNHQNSVNWTVIPQKYERTLTRQPCEIQLNRLNIITGRLVITLMKCIKQFRRGVKRYFVFAMAVIIAGYRSYWHSFITERRSPVSHSTWNWWKFVHHRNEPSLLV